MSFLRKGNCIAQFTVISRLDSGRRAWREVYLTTTIDGEGKEEKCVLVIYDYELTREAGLLPKSKCPYEVDYMEYLDFDVENSRYWDSGEWVNRKGRRFLYVVYQYAEGVRLDKFMKRKSHPKLGVDFMEDLCEIVRNINIITAGGGHNAISPENIIVRNMGGGKYKPYLIGYADMWKPTKRKKPCNVELLDHRFRAPETFTGAFSEASDIYSLALIFCYILAGDAICDYSLASLQEMSESQRQNLVTSSSYIMLDNINFPDNDLRVAVEKALQPNPKDRYMSAAFLKYALTRTSVQMQEFEGLCDNLFAQGVEQKKSFFEKNAKPLTFKSDDFDALLDQYIKNELEKDDSDDADTLLPDKKLFEELDDTNDNPLDFDLPFDTDLLDFEDSRSKVNVSVRKCCGRGFADVAGMENLKQLLKRNFVDIILHKEKAKKYNIKPSNGILLYGPPGCGKTYIAEKIAEEAKLNFLMVKPSDLGSTYIHGSQTKIADLFKKAEESAPTLLCFDEFDTLVPSRNEESHHSTVSEVNEFLVQLNNCASRGIYVLAMTNNINLIDTAVLRKGRIDEVIYVSEPDIAAREEIFELELTKCEMAGANLNLQHLADITRGYTSSDIAYIVMEASREAFRQSIEIDDLVEVDQTIIEKVISRTSPSISPKELKYYEDMRKEFIDKKKQLEIRPRIGFAV